MTPFSKLSKVTLSLLLDKSATCLEPWHDPFLLKLVTDVQTTQKHVNTSQKLCDCGIQHDNIFPQF